MKGKTKAIIGKAKRKAISVKTRFEVFKRDDFTCHYCGSHPPKAVLHVDHIHPVSKGGSNDEDNLVTACDGCNLGKGARLLSDAAQPLANRAAEIAEREEQIRGYSEVMQAKKERLESESWMALESFLLQFSPDDRSIRRDWFTSVKRFIKDLGLHEVQDAMELAVTRCPNSEYQCFKYFCGVCWRKIKEDL